MFAKSQLPELSQCVVITHSVRENWEVSDTKEAYLEAMKLIAETSRTKIVEKSKDYLHAEATTKWMHYVDDLEIKVLESDHIIQVRSESRVGIGDNGVNKKRVDSLANRMSNKIRRIKA